jgi:hypothetical protein
MKSRTCVQFRSARRMDKVTQTPLGDLGANKARLEKMRIALGWDKVNMHICLVRFLYNSVLSER